VAERERERNRQFDFKTNPASSSSSFHNTSITMRIYKFFYTDDAYDVDTTNDFWANLTNKYSAEDDFTSNYEAVGKCYWLSKQVEIYHCAKYNHNNRLTDNPIAIFRGHVVGNCNDIYLLERHSLRCDYVYVRVVEEVTSECVFF